MRVYPELDVSLVPAPTVIIVGLPAGLRLAVDNAIANAVKHGGATRVQLSAVSSRAGVEIAIDDDGVGVPEEERTVVFERFSRGSTASHSGSGLGLALVAQQAELHGGTASLEAEPAGRRPTAAAAARSVLGRLLLPALGLAAVPTVEASRLGGRHVAEPHLGDRSARRTGSPACDRASSPRCP